MDFIKDLEEARMTRTGTDQRKLTYADCTERLYLSLLVLELLRRNPKFSSKVKSYADNTSRYNGYDKFRLGASDMYNFIYFVSGPEEAQDRLRDPGAAKIAAKQSTLSLNVLNGYLHKLRAGVLLVDAEQIILKVEKSLKVTNTDYKEIRRGITHFESLSDTSKKKVVTKLLFAARAKLRSSDLIDDLEKLATDGNFETSAVLDTEPTISTPDLSQQGPDIANYRYLVGAKNIAMTKKFLDQARNNNGVPNIMLQAYLPVIQMIDNIVKGGPGFIQQLKVLEKRAKKSRK